MHPEEYRSKDGECGKSNHRPPIRDGYVLPILGNKVSGILSVYSMSNEMFKGWLGTWPCPKWPSLGRRDPTWKELEVSIDGGTPKWMVSKGKSHYRMI